MVKDPVCRCEVDPNAAEFKTDYNGRTYFFCTEACKAKFDAAPKQWSADIIRAERSKSE